VGAEELAHGDVFVAGGVDDGNGCCAIRRGLFCQVAVIAVVVSIQNKIQNKTLNFLKPINCMINNKNQWKGAATCKS